MSTPSIMPQRPLIPPSSRRARGVAVLHVTLVLVLLSSLAVFYTARDSINEQRVSANELRTQHAYNAAMSGLDYAAAYMNDGRDVLAFPPGIALSAAPNSYYQVQFCSPDPAIAGNPPACPSSRSTPLVCTPPDRTKDEDKAPLVVSCGWSDDNRAVVQMVELVAGGPTQNSQLNMPVVTAGSNNMLTGGGSILNFHNDLTVWSGGSVPTQSATGKTFVRDLVAAPSADPAIDFRNVGNSPSCNNPPQYYRCSSSGTGIGPDVIANDTSLSTLTNDQFFQAFMGTSRESFRDTIAKYKVDLNGTLPDTQQDSTSISSLTGMADTSIWVEGNVTSSIGNIGTVDKPVVLVINGDWDVSGSPVIHGVVFVNGTISGTGSPTIYGALLSRQVTLNGNAKVVYDPNAIRRSVVQGKATFVPGTWRDWRR